MGWLKFTLTLPREDVASMERDLEALGAVSVSLTDAADEPVIEPDPGEAPLWSRAVMSALFEDREGVGEDLRGLAARWRQSMVGGLADLEISRREDRDWSDTWREGLAPRCFSERLWVTPSYARPPEDGRPVLVIDPGLAFGSGIHPTTTLCLSWLSGLDLEGAVVADYGCGCGILALAALRLGARQVIAVDHDPQALVSTRDNLARNDLGPERIWIGPPDEVPQLHCDLVVANIFSRVLTMLSDELTRLVATDGQLGLSGMLPAQCDAVKGSFASFRFDQSTTLEGWSLLVGRRGVAA